ncbi:MAG: DMT family transporter [Neisseria sp.]|nr:DMT family transporter [Neisseria sp.]
MKHSPAAGSLWMLAATVSFALMGVFVKRAGSHFAFYELVFYRTAFAVVVLTVLALMQQRQFATPHVFAHVWRGLAGTLGLVLYFYAVVHLPLATAVTLNYTSPLWLAVLSVVFLRERLSRNVVWMLLCGFIGIVVLLRPSLNSGQEAAAVIALLSGAAGGWAYLQVRELTRLNEPEWKVVWSFSLIAALCCALWGFAAGWHGISRNHVPDLIGIGFFALIAQLCLTRAYKVGQKFVVASLSYFTVVFSVLFGLLVFGEILQWQEWAGIVIITLVGVAGSLSARKTT